MIRNAGSFLSLLCLAIFLNACQRSINHDIQLADGNPLIGNRYDSGGCVTSTGFGRDFTSIIINDGIGSATRVTYDVRDKSFGKAINKEIIVTSEAGDQAVYLAMPNSVEFEYVVVAGVTIHAPVTAPLLMKCDGTVDDPSADKYVQGNSSNSLGQGIFVAISFADERAVRRLLALGVSPDAPMSAEGGISSSTPLQLAQAQGKQAIFEILQRSLRQADQTSGTVNANDDAGSTNQAVGLNGQ